MSAMIEISAFNAVPEFAQGLARDLRIRWACEEIQKPYESILVDGSSPRSEAYLKLSPFGLIPALRHGNVEMFESGAILLHLAECDERLLPRDPARRERTISWLFAALNTVEPPLMFIALLDFFAAGQSWTDDARPLVMGFAEQRLQMMSFALGDHHWIADEFSIADIAMITVLRSIRHTDLVSRFPNLATYQARGEARSAFQLALGAHLDDLGRPQGEW